jgi:hypothetical protein
MRAPRLHGSCSYLTQLDVVPEEPVSKNAFVVVVVVVLVLAGCRGEQERPHVDTRAAVSTPSRDVFALGTTVTNEGAVPADSTGETFPRGGEVYLSVNVEGASVEQEIAVSWVGPNGRVLHRHEVEVPKGSRWAAFSSGETHAWPAGEHRAVVTINGRRVSERPFSLM